MRKARWNQNVELASTELQTMICDLKQGPVELARAKLQVMIRQLEQLSAHADKAREHLVQLVEELGPQFKSLHQDVRVGPIGAAC